ncbi:MAG TPA: succinyl-diaminopimelate desuccinylase, partial [Ramlibacter sp.]|nr:succinyl-diaminopimelate desuccinylase [Ramlibacter sp.]
MSGALHLTEQLISRRSVTPEDDGCQRILAGRLKPLGFSCETIESGPADFRVTNLWARRAGKSPRTLVFAGHTDVVPTGPLEQWT